MVPVREKPGIKREALREAYADSLHPCHARELAVVGAALRAAAQILRHEKDDAVEQKDDGDEARVGEELLQLRLEDESEDAGGDRAYDDEEPDARVRRYEAPARDGAEHVADDAYPVAIEEKRSARAVARWVRTTNETNESLDWSILQCRRAGRSTLCPRLDTGKSSETPWSVPSMIAWRYVSIGLQRITAPDCRACVRRGIRAR